jgi:hypothetical protein
MSLAKLIPISLEYEISIKYTVLLKFGPHLPIGKVHTGRQNWKKVALFSREIAYIIKFLG